MYSITEAGEAYLETWIYSLERHQKIIEMFLRSYAQGKNGSLFGSEADHYERENADG
jgi:DNA-binding PadR family transcriptional regulator